MDNIWIPLDFEKTDGITQGWCVFIPLAGSSIETSKTIPRGLKLLLLSIGCIFRLLNEIKKGEAASQEKVNDRNIYIRTSCA